MEASISRSRYLVIIVAYKLEFDHPILRKEKNFSTDIRELSQSSFQATFVQVIEYVIMTNQIVHEFNIPDQFFRGDILDEIPVSPVPMISESPIQSPTQDDAQKNQITIHDKTVQKVTEAKLTTSDDGSSQHSIQDFIMSSTALVYHLSEMSRILHNQLNNMLHGEYKPTFDLDKFFRIETNNPLLSIPNSEMKPLEEKRKRDDSGSENEPEKRRKSTTISILPDNDGWVMLTSEILRSSQKIAGEMLGIPSSTLAKVFYYRNDANMI